MLQIKASHARYVRILAAAKTQVAGPAPQIQNAFRGGDSGEFDCTGWNDDQWRCGSVYEEFEVSC